MIASLTAVVACGDGQDQSGLFSDDGSGGASADASAAGTGGAQATAGTDGGGAVATGGIGGDGGGIAAGGAGGSGAEASGGADAGGTGGVAAGGSGTGGSGTGGSPACTDACTAGNSQCVGTQYQMCAVQPNGCAAWNAPIDCATGACLGGQCVPGCADRCTPGAAQCVGVQLQTCSIQPSGCSDWNLPTDCNSGETCNGGACVVICLDQCAEGATRCYGSQVQTCFLQANGCTDWDLPTSCDTGMSCVGSDCACANQCTPPEARCSTSQLQSCSTLPNGCAVWNAPADCPFGQTCSGGACVAVCTDQCTAGSTQCAGQDVQTCSVQPNGCTDWDPAASCGAGRQCTGSACACANPCTQSQTRCAGAQVETCTVQATGCLGWGAAQNCPGTETCQGSACSCNDLCTLGATRCAGDQVETCEIQGTGCTDWGPAAACPGTETCQGTDCACNDQCTLSDTSCSGPDLITCELQATGCTDWGAPTSCPEFMSCIAGSCVCSAGGSACCGALGEPCCTGTCDASLACGAADTCGDPCDPGFLVLRPTDGLVPGTRISSSYIDPTKLYIWGRSRSSLSSVGVSAALYNLTGLVDGVGPFNPDGFYDLDELLTITCPAYFVTLFPSEQALIPVLFAFLAYDDLPVIPVAPQPIYDLTVTDISTPPTELTFAPSEPISSLPTDLQGAATRLELVFNDDGDASTVSMQDCQDGINDPLGRFNSSDVADFNEIYTLLHSHGTSTVDARAIVPEPFDRINGLASLGNVQFRILEEISYLESRSYSPQTYSNGWDVRLNMTHSMQPQLLVPTGSSVILLRIDARGEIVRSQGASPAYDIPAGQYMVEEWQSGSLGATYRIDLPALTSVTRYTDLTAIVDFVLETPGGMVLTRNPQEAYYFQTGTNPGRYIVSFSFDVGTVPPGGSYNPSYVVEVENPNVPLPFGRYEVNTPSWGTVYIDYYKSGVMYVTFLNTGVRNRMIHLQTNQEKNYADYSTGNPAVLFRAEIGTNLTMFSPTFSIDLDSTMRTQ